MTNKEVMSLTVGARVIEIKERGDGDFIAFFHGEDFWGIGKTSDAAVSDLVLTHAKKIVTEGYLNTCFCYIKIEFYPKIRDYEHWKIVIDNSYGIGQTFEMALLSAIKSRMAGIAGF